jgi:hypothetical protein
MSRSVRGAHSVTLNVISYRIGKRRPKREKLNYVLEPNKIERTVDSALGRCETGGCSKDELKSSPDNIADDGAAVPLQSAYMQAKCAETDTWRGK